MHQLNDRLRSLRLAVAEGTQYRRERALGRLLRGETLSPDERDCLAESLSVDDAVPARVALLDFESGAGELELVREAVPDALGCVELERGEIALVLHAADDRSLTAARQTLGPSCTIGVSDPVDELDALTEACEAARHAVRYRFRFGAGALIAASRCITEKPYVVPDDGLRRFSEHARLPDAAGAARISQELLADVRSYTYEDFVFLTQHLLYAIERLFAGLRGANDGLSQLRALRVSMRWADTPERVSEVVERWCSSYAAQARSQAADKTTGIVADIRRMVDENLGSPDLGAKLIAERLRMSVNYLRSVFKQAAGQSLSSYITRLRIRLCEQLLRECRITVKDAFMQAGFSNYTYAFTLFKKQTGKTPQEYQRANQSL
jgi:AraC-like DNA-binding protein